MTKRDKEVAERSKNIIKKAKCLKKAMVGGTSCYFLMDCKLSSKKWSQEQVQNVKFCINCFKELQRIAKKNRHCFSNKLKKTVLKKDLKKLLEEHDLKKSNI